MKRPEERYSSRITLCVVCGETLQRYQRICDRCGSIQRTVAGDGVPVPPDSIGSCERCGAQIPGDQQYCEECFLVLNPEEQATLRRLALVKVAKVTSFSLAASGVAAMIAASVLTGTAFVVIICIGAGMIVIFGGTYGLIALRERKRTHLDPPIILKPILPQSKPASKSVRSPSKTESGERKS